MSCDIRMNTHAHPCQVECQWHPSIPLVLQFMHGLLLCAHRRVHMHARTRTLTRKHKHIHVQPWGSDEQSFARYMHQTFTVKADIPQAAFQRSRVACMR